MAEQASALNIDHRGKSFLLTFFPNYASGNEKIVIIITSQYNATVYIQISNTSGSDDTRREYKVQAGSSLHVTLAAHVVVSTNQVAEKKAVLVVASHPVSVYCVNLDYRTSDGYLAIPMEALGTHYVVATYDFTDSQLVVAAAEDDTLVTVTVRVMEATMCGDVNLKIRDSAEIHFRLQAQETVRVLCDKDITGSVVTSNKPVAVISGNTCAKVPPKQPYCDHLVEMMVPVPALGTRYLLHAFEGRSMDAIYRLVPGQKGTQINFELQPVIFGSLPFREFPVTQNSTAVVTSDKPLMVVGYTMGQGSKYGSEIGDPMMTLLASPDLAPADYLLDLDLYPRHSNFTFSCYVTAVVKEDFATGVFLGDQAFQMRSAVKGLSEELTVNAKNTSKEKHRHQSASDNRASAAGIGIVGVCLLALVLGLIVIMDAITFISYGVSMIRKFRKRSRKVKAGESGSSGHIDERRSAEASPEPCCPHSPVKALSSLENETAGGLADLAAQAEVSRFVESMAMEAPHKNLLPQHRGSRRKNLLHVRPDTILLHVRSQLGGNDYDDRAAGLRKRDSQSE
ncbi:hypothetical protein ACOMHN_053844 [Nucella lapillus]